jgi:Eukaryotic porin
VSKPAALSLKAEGSLPGGLKLDSLKISSDKKVAGEFSYAEVIPHTSVNFKFSDGSRAAGADAITASLGATYKTNWSVSTLDVDALNYIADATTLVEYNSILLGGSVKAALSGFDLKDYAAVVGYQGADYKVSVAGEKKLTAGVAAYHQKLNSTIAVAAIARFPLAMKASTSSVDLDLGLSYKLADATTLHAKVNSAGKVAVSYAQEVSSLTKLTFATEVDAANITSDDHKFGLLLNVTA